MSILPLVSSPLEENEDKKVEGLFPLTSSTKKENTAALVGVSVVLGKEAQDVPQQPIPQAQKLSPVLPDINGNDEISAHLKIRKLRSSIISKP